MDLGIRELSNSWRQRNEVGAEYCLLSRWNKNKNCDSRPPENEEKIVMIQKNVKDFNDIEDKKEDRILKWHLKPSNQFMEHRKYVWLLKSMHQKSATLVETPAEIYLANLIPEILLISNTKTWNQKRPG